MPDTSDFDKLPTDRLLGMRADMIRGNEQVGVCVLEGRASGEMVEGARIRVALVDRLDAALLKRGEEVPPPFWLE